MPNERIPSAAESGGDLAARVERQVAACPVFDIHTHLYDPAFESLLLWGLDELLIYHYLVAEAFRVLHCPPPAFAALSKRQQADRIWEALFVRHSPLSEACRGVITTLNRLGLDPRQKDLKSLRRWFASQKPGQHLDRVLALAGVRQVCMTNSPFDDEERAVWERGFRRDERFVAGLRVDPLLTDWERAAHRLDGWGYAVAPRLTPHAFDEVQRFLRAWHRRMKARYLMVSLPPDFQYPAHTPAAQLIERAVLPFCEEEGLPFALMLGVKRAVNPQLGLAGDGVGRSDLTGLQNLCAGHPENRFLVTVLSRENQHELCVLARKFSNLHVFGCWWFTNVPLLIEEITRQRLELIGPTFTPQHSDARVLDQLVYKWTHFRQILARVLTDKYAALAAAGWCPTDAEIERDVQGLLGGAFERFCRP